MNTDNYIQIMIDSLHKKEKVLTQLIKLNDEQTKIASTEEFSDEDFYANIESKGGLIEELIRLNEGFDALIARVKEEVNENRAKYADQIKQLQELIKTVTELGVKVEAQEARNKMLVEKRFSRMKREVAAAGKNTKMANIYYKTQNRIYNEAHFLDDKK